MTARAGLTITLPLLAALAGAAVSAQQGAAGGTRFIVRAVSNGEPVADLKPADITLRINGKPTEVSSLQFVSAADAAPAAAAAGPKPSNLPPPFSSNTASAGASGPAGGREFLIVLDEDGIGPGQEGPVKLAISRLMKEAGESSRFGLLSLRIGGPSVPPSAGSNAVNEALARFVGAASSAETSVDLTCRSKRAMDTLGSALQSAPAGRTLVLFSSGMSANPPEVQSIRSKVNAAGEIDNTLPETCQIRSQDLEMFGITAAMSPANMYVVHYPQGLIAQQNLQAATSGIENIAGVSQSEMIRMQGGDEPSLSRIIKETDSYYIATVDGLAPGPIRRVEARAARDGVRVNAHPAESAAGRAMAGGGRGGREGGGKASPRDMIRVATVYRDLPLRAAAFLSKGSGNDVKVMILFEGDEPDTKLNAATIMFFDEKGTGKAQWNAQNSDLQGSPVLAASVVPAGTYRVRVAATDAKGRAGTTDIDLNAQLTDAAPLKLGNLVLGTDPKSPKLQ
ncbi:MAG: hypothetical protein M3Y40_09260, partial [Chloroflexota bacterium]|nr:hypothetical protein [Chloroflexota bacterium]